MPGQYFGQLTAPQPQAQPQPDFVDMFFKAKQLAMAKDAQAMQLQQIDLERQRTEAQVSEMGARSSLVLQQALQLEEQRPSQLKGAKAEAETSQLEFEAKPQDILLRQLLQNAKITEAQTGTQAHQAAITASGLQVDVSRAELPGVRMDAEAKALGMLSTSLAKTTTLEQADKVLLGWSVGATEAGFPQSVVDIGLAQRGTDMPINVIIDNINRASLNHVYTTLQDNPNFMTQVAGIKLGVAAKPAAEKEVTLAELSKAYEQLQTQVAIIERSGVESDKSRKQIEAEKAPLFQSMGLIRARMDAFYAPQEIEKGVGRMMEQARPTSQPTSASAQQAVTNNPNPSIPTTPRPAGEPGAVWSVKYQMWTIQKKGRWIGVTE